MTDPNLLVQRYLDIFRANLTRMPESERNELVAEIQSHITEACNSGQSVADVLTRLGPADRLARSYLVEQLLDPVSGGSRVRRFFAVAGIVATMSLSSIIIVPLLGGLGIGFSVGGLAAIVAGFAALAFPGLVSQPVPLPFGVPQGVAIIIGVILAGLGALSLWSLVAYIRFIVGAGRRVLAN